METQQAGSYRFKSFIRDEDINNWEAEEADFFENYEDALGVYNEDYQNEEVVDDPDSFDQEDVCSPNYNPLDLFVDDMLFP